MEAEVEYITKQGNHLFGYLHASLLRIDEKRVLLIRIADITNLKSKEEEALRSEVESRAQLERLREEGERFRKIFEDGHFGMAMIGLDFKFLKANNTFCETLSYSEDELKQMTFLEII